MKRQSWLISKYLLQNILPYFIFSWLLLSVILFIQQASRYSEIFFSVFLPKHIIWELALALVPNVVAFTCPMAILIGIIIGLSKMQGDSELIAIRGAGVGNFQITLPILLLGLLLSFFAFFINLKGVPFAAGIVRKVALQTALYKLESPIEPGVFNTEVGGYTIYVKDVDFEKGIWKNIFIYQEDKKSGQARLITSTSGRIDNLDDTSELVLRNAVVTTIPIDAETAPEKKFISENVGEIRFSVKTRRGEIAERLTKTEATPEELGLRELARYARSAVGKQKIEAEILWERRLFLSITPLIFALLGTSLILRFNRGGRGFGIFVALVSLIIYYLLALLSEQIARAHNISIFLTSLIPLSASFLAITWFFLSNRFFLRSFPKLFGRTVPVNFRPSFPKISRKNFYIDLTTGILDFDIVVNLLKYFLLTFAFLTSIYLIFTAFELWKFAGVMPNGVSLLGKYLIYLLPLIYIQLAPSALMVATLATFVIKSRQNEIVTWTSAGQSVYRLLMPCFVLMIALGFVNLLIQEVVLPGTNLRQDELRTELRSRGASAKNDAKFWVANGDRIYSFEQEKEAPAGRVKNLSIYEFSPETRRLTAVYKDPAPIVRGNFIKFSEQAEKKIFGGGQVETAPAVDVRLKENENPFDNVIQKPGHLSTLATKALLRETESEVERRNLEVALQKKYTTLFLPFLITLFTAPFALSLSRKGKALTVGYAVGMWLAFLGLTNVFEQMGLNGHLPPTLAVWTPLILFALFGVYLLSRVRT